MSNIMISIGSAIALAAENPRATAVIFGIAFIVSFGLFARPDASVAWRGMGRLSLAALTSSPLPNTTVSHCGEDRREMSYLRRTARRHVARRPCALPQRRGCPCGRELPRRAPYL